MQQKSLAICYVGVFALEKIASFPCGVEACLAAGAVPLLTAAFASETNEWLKHIPEGALVLLGYDEHGVQLP